MKKTVILRIMSFLPVCLLWFVFSSCRKDDENKIICGIRATFNIEVSADILDYFDVSVTYIDDKNKENTVVLTEEKWTYKLDNASTLLPESLCLKAVMRPKADYPDINPDVLYSIKREAGGKGYADLKIPGAVWSRSEYESRFLSGYTYSNRWAQPLAGKAFEECLGKGEQVICDYRYDIDYNKSYN